MVKLMIVPRGENAITFSSDCLPQLEQMETQNKNRDPLGTQIFKGVPMDQRFQHGGPIC